MIPVLVVWGLYIEKHYIRGKYTLNEVINEISPCILSGDTFLFSSQRLLLVTTFKLMFGSMCLQYFANTLKKVLKFKVS